MAALLEVLASIPAAVWSGLLGALLALSGVLLSNRGNTQRLKVQLAHDAAEKAKERTATLRRETCLRTVESLANVSAFLGGLPQADLAKANATEALQGFLAAAARLQLVGEPKTALLVSELAAAYGELLLRLMVDLQPMQLLRAEIAVCDAFHDKAQAEINRLLGEMSKLNEAAQPNPAVFQALSRTLDFHRDRAAELNAERLRHGLRFGELQAVFIRHLFAEMKHIGAQQIPVLVEIRRDLGLGGDLTAYQSQLEAQHQRVAEQLDRTLAALQAGATAALTDAAAPPVAAA